MTPAPDMRTHSERTASAAHSLDARDVTAIVGLIMLAAGCAMAWPPLGLIVPGAVLTWKALRP